MISSSPGKIQNILFDLGGVLLDLDFDATFRTFRHYSRKSLVFDIKQLNGLPIFTEFETGLITPTEFREAIRAWLHNPDISDQEIDKAWCSMLLTVPAAKVELLKEISLRFRIYLYSNTNAIHIGFFKRAFQLQHQIEWESLFSNCFYSHIINDRKPLVSGFEKVLQRAGIEAHETLFVDDLQVNTQAAASLGMEVADYIPGQDLASVITAKLL